MNASKGKGMPYNIYGPDFNLDGTRKVFTQDEMDQVDRMISGWTEEDWQTMLDGFMYDHNLDTMSMSQLKCYLQGPLRNAEHFTYRLDTGILMFNVGAANQIIDLNGSSQGREIYNIPVAEYYDTFIKSGRVEVSTARLLLPLIDVSIPSIAVDMGELYGAFLIDGYHRLARAALDGRKYLPAYFLSERETSAILYSAQSVTPEWDRSQFGSNPLEVWEATRHAISA